MTLDLTKPVQTRDGSEAKISGTDNPGDYPVYGYIKASDDEWVPECWTREGRQISDAVGDLDIINVPVKLMRWVNVYRKSDGTFSVFPFGYRTENDARCRADTYGDKTYLGTYEAEITTSTLKEE